MNESARSEHAVAKTADVADGEVLRVEVGEREIAIFNVEGTFYATSNVCTHSYASLADGYVEGATIECPLHGGIFDIKTGKAIEEPCTEDIETYPVRIDGDDVLVAVPGD